MFATKNGKSIKERFKERKDKKRFKKEEKKAFRMVPEKKKSYKWVAVPVAFVLLLSLIVYVLYDNGRITVDYVTVEHPQIPASFDGFRILQISDIHGKMFGEENRNLVELIDSLEYDMILLTGDYMSDPDSGNYWDVIDILTDIEDRDVPVLYILGESDYMPDDSEDLGDKWNMCIEPDEKTNLMERIEDIGAKFVYPIQKIERGSDAIYFTGISYKEKIFDELDFDVDKHFSICVTHKPIDYDVNARLKEMNAQKLTEVDYDLSISGHTHAGQFRLPLLGAVYIKGKGIFPQESSSSGLHSDGQGRLNYITPGLGASGPLPFRFCNPPAVSLITLKCKK